MTILPYKRLLFMKDTIRLAKDQVSPESDVCLEHYTGIREALGGGTEVGSGVLHDYRSILFARHNIDIKVWIGTGGESDHNTLQ